MKGTSTLAEPTRGVHSLPGVLGRAVEVLRTATKGLREQAVILVSGFSTTPIREVSSFRLTTRA